MKYEEMIKVVANTDKTVLDRGDAVVRDFGKVIDSIMDYRYAVENYKGDTESVITDKAMTVKNSIALLESDLDIYKEVLGITDKVEEKKCSRMTKILGRINGIIR